MSEPETPGMDFLTGLARRALGVGPGVRPRLRPRFGASQRSWLPPAGGSAPQASERTEEVGVSAPPAGRDGESDPGAPE